LAHQERLNIAVFIDFDNIEIGVKSTLGEHFDIGTILEALKERGEVVTKIAYADWTRAGEYSRALTQHAIRLVQRNLTPGGDKNGADINLALDALEMAFTHQHINAYVIVGGDSDFLSLVEKLKQYDKKVFVVGGRAFTSVILQRNCHEFIAYENLVRKPAARGGRPAAQATASPIAQAFPIVRRALKILADREVSPQTGLLKSTLLQLDSTFSERNYGASSFLDFVEKLAHSGLVQLKHSGRSVMVELNTDFDEGDGEVRTESKAAGRAEARPRASEDGESTDVEEAAGGRRGFDGPGAPGSIGSNVQQFPSPAAEAAAPAGDNAEGVRIAASIFAAATTARWPMYVRNAKQILRAAGFDERRYGFGGLIDLLRACQRDGIVRLERDRRGGLRVFQGAAFARPAQPADAETAAALSSETVEVMPVNAIVDATEGSEPDLDIIDVPPVEVVDTTAELLGRAKARRPRTRAAAHAGAGGETAPRPTRRAAGTKKAAAPRRGGRRKRTASGE
jgi:uncharacterized LabA/DUF88 family protein